MKDYMFLLSLNIIKKGFEDYIEMLFDFLRTNSVPESIWEHTADLVNKICELESFNNKNEILLKQKEINMLFDTLIEDIKCFYPGNSEKLNLISEKLTYLKLLFCRCILNLLRF